MCCNYFVSISFCLFFSFFHFFAFVKTEQLEETCPPAEKHFTNEKRTTERRTCGNSSSSGKSRLEVIHRRRVTSEFSLNDFECF